MERETVLTLAGWTVAIAIALVLLGVAELALRWTYPERVQFPAVDHALEPDPVLIYRARPSSDGRFRRNAANGGDVIEWSINSLGFRGAELRDDCDSRLVVYGDSNVMAIFSAEGQTFVRTLHDRLSAVLAGCLEVINAGVVGYGPDQSLLRLKQDVGRLAPRLIVLHVFSDNDFGDLLRNRLFVAHGTALRPHPDPLPYSGLSRWEKTRRGASGLLLTQSLQWLLERGTEPEGAPTAGSTDGRPEYVERLLAQSQAEYARYVGDGPEPERFDHYDADIALRPDSASAQTKLRLMRAVLREARDFLDPRGIRLLVVIQPSAIDLTRNAALDYEYLASYPAYDRARLSSWVADACSTLGIAHVDLFHEFGRRDADDLYFGGGDNHWNDRGQAVAAEIVAAAISGLMEAPPSGSGSSPAGVDR